MKPAKWMGHDTSISGPEQSMLSCLPTHFAMKPAKWMGHDTSILGPDQSLVWEAAALAARYCSQEPRV
jgi:hypothetical protein